MEVRLETLQFTADPKLIFIFQDSNLTIKTINLGDLSALVVSTQKRDAVGPFGFQHQQVGERLQTVIPSVNKISLQMTEVY